MNADVFGVTRTSLGGKQKLQSWELMVIEFSEDGSWSVFKVYIIAMVDMPALLSCHRYAFNIFGFFLRK